MTARLVTMAGAMLLAVSGGVAAAPCPLDQAFDGDGKARIAIPGVRVAARHVVTHPLGGYLVAGAGTDRTSGEFVAFVMRLTHDGRLNPTFGTDGIATWTDATFGVVAAESSTVGLSIRPDGSSHLLVNLSLGNDANAQRVLRFDVAGQLDPGFGVNGVAALSGGNLGSGGMIVDGDGRVYVSSLNFVFFAVWGLERLTPSGMPDYGFGVQGFRGYAIGRGIPRLVVREGGLELATTVDGNLLRTLRVDFDGNPDPTYGGGDGVADANGPAQPMVSVVRQGDRLLAAGITSDFHLMRLDAAGEFDVSFGDGTGRQTVPITPAIDIGTGIATPAGRIVLVGAANVLFQESIGVAYLDADGRPAPECDAAQTYSIAEGPQARSGAIGAVADGPRIIAVGTTSSIGDELDEVGVIAIDPGILLQDGFEG